MKWSINCKLQLHKVVYRFYEKHVWMSHTIRSWLRDGALFLRKMQTCCSQFSSHRLQFNNRLGKVQVWFCFCFFVFLPVWGLPESAAPRTNYSPPWRIQHRAANSVKKKQTSPNTNLWLNSVKVQQVSAASGCSFLLLWAGTTTKHVIGLKHWRHSPLWRGGDCCLHTCNCAEITYSSYYCSVLL